MTAQDCFNIFLGVYSLLILGVVFYLAHRVEELEKLIILRYTLFTPAWHEAIIDNYAKQQNDKD